MADRQEAVVKPGEQIITPPAALPLKPDEQFRLVNSRLDALTAQVDKIAKPPHFRIADVVTLIALIVGFATALIVGFGLSERISEANTRQSDTERRLDASVAATELRLGAKLDKLSDQFTAMDERTSRLEGEKSSKAEKPR